MGGNPLGQGPTPQLGKGKIKEPSIFAGDRDKLEIFLEELLLQFLGRPFDYSNDQVKIATALSYIEGDKVAAWKHGFLSTSRTYGSLGTWDNFERLLRQAYSPIAETEDALIKLQELKYREGTPADVFVAKFWDLVSRAKMYDKQTQTSMLLLALPGSVRDNLEIGRAHV